MDKYLVTDGGHNQLILNGEELMNFVRVAVVHNKDISSFNVQRIDSTSCQSAPHLSRESARIQVVEAAFFRAFNL